ncbi:GvpL/GvpF family gas vesicle protein [Arthrobacter sp. H14]|uniref:GvpL/GvpF family gas vesicle protein n=1 Tax=Arthrobacter sp. H14 TaxID=1312959 RepID=UPI0004B95C57|nr:GvpL/GvpF family gas vesicle protein [Arthrobacter sp. H14]
MSVEETNLVGDQYVYGIVPAEAELPQGLAGVKDEPVEKLVSGGFAALVTPVRDPDSVGTPDDLLAHSTVLDRIAAEGPVLPMTFGTIVPDAETITSVVMPSMQDTYAESMRRVDGATQFTVRARYVRERVIGEMVAENREIAALRESTASQSEDASHYDRIRLGQLVVEEFQRKAAVDSEDIVAALSPLVRETSVRETTQADDVVELALLVDRGSAEGFEQAVEKLAEETLGRISFRLLGPQAPYDFVGEV